MTTTTVQPDPLGVTRRPGPFGLVRAELLKLRTTNTWWWFALGALAWLAAALAVNLWFANTAFNQPEVFGGDEGVLDPLFHGGNVYTSGQFLGLMFVMLIGIVMVTSEYFHQTATTTYLATPHRTTVLAAKLLTAVLVGLVFWVITTAIAVGVGATYFSAQETGTMLGETEVQRIILLNLAAYVVWAIFGVAIGSLITSQLAATIIAAVAYLVGTQLASILFLLLSNLLDNESLLEWQVVVPSIASQVMTTGGEGIPGVPAWWVGALILLGYAVVAGGLGTLITRKRDIS